jgi:carotenoid cleavage dioxygenase-like enzyme
VLGYVLGFRGPAQGVFFDDARIRNGEGTTLHALDRSNGGKAERYVCKEAYHPIHVANAWDGASGPCMIAACWPPDCVNAMASERRDILGDWAPLLGGDFSGAAVTQLVIFSGHGGAASARVLCNGAHLDHCKVHPAVGGLENKFVYASAGAAVARGDINDLTYAAPQPPQAFVRVDVSEDAVVDAWFCGERRFTDDAVLAATGDEETDAFLVAPVYDASTRRSTIVVLDCGADTVSYWVRHRRDALPSTQATSPRDRSASSPCLMKRHLFLGASTAPGVPQRDRSTHATEHV